jgi:hypothetical protein
VGRPYEAGLDALTLADYTGLGTAVAAAGSAKIAYDNVLKSFVYSIDGGAWTPMSLSGSTVGPDNIFGWAGLSYPYNNGSVTDVTISGATTYDNTTHPGGILRCRKLTINASVTLRIKCTPFYIFCDELYGAGASAVIDISGFTGVGTEEAWSALGGRVATTGGNAKGGNGGGILFIVCNKTTGTAITIRADGGAGAFSGTNVAGAMMGGEGALGANRYSAAAVSEKWTGTNTGSSSAYLGEYLGTGGGDMALPGGSFGGSGGVATDKAAGGSGIGGGGGTGGALGVAAAARIMPPPNVVYTLAESGCMGGGGGAATSNGPSTGGGGGGAVCVWRKSTGSTVAHTLSAAAGSGSGGHAGGVGITYDTVLA